MQRTALAQQNLDRARQNLFRYETPYGVLRVSEPMETWQRVSFEVQAAFREFGEYSPSNPPPWRLVSEYIERESPHSRTVSALLDRFDMPSDSSRTGRFEQTSRLRDPDDDATDTMGEETDDSIGMGEAETWFREQQEETP